MPAFTYTAPQITAEQAREEREALSQEERERVDNDLYGTGSRTEETEEMRKNALELFDTALGCIPDEQKSAYLEALERAPDLVEKEFPPLDFIRCEKYDAWAASKKYVAWWATRKQIFGSERAYLPMTIDGAMAEDRQYLEKAVFLILPNDEFGRPVLLFDRIQCFSSGISRTSLLRIWFYTAFVLCEMGDAPRYGIVSLINYRGYDLYKHYDRGVTKNFAKIADVMPININAIHIFSGTGKSVLEFVFPILIHMTGKELRLRTKLHSGAETQVFSNVKEYGLKWEHIEMIYAYEFRRMDRAKAWVEKRIELESRSAMQ